MIPATLLAAVITFGLPTIGGTALPTVAAVPDGAGIHGHPLWDSWYDLGDLGYEEREYFISGTATSSSNPAQSADYVTRILVRRPIDASKFNGTVLLDWVNVTAQFENAVDTIEAHEFLRRKGYVYVHVSAQAAGLCCTPLTPKIWDPVRYADLSHPGDDYAFDIFTQIAQVIRTPTGTDPTGGLAVEKILAAGQSQSASRLSTYVRDVQASAGVIDGFLIHSGGSKTFDEAPAAPVLHLLSDAEASPAPPSHGVTDNYVLWEVAGSAHSDFWVGYHQETGNPLRITAGIRWPGKADEHLHQVAGNYGEYFHPMHLTCILAGSAFPVRYSVAAAIHHLNRWVRGDGTPPVAPRYEFDGEGMLALDEHGNAKGGVRLPPVEVPVATYVSTICVLGGITLPFDDIRLRLLYPTFADYYCPAAAAAAAAVNAGFLLPADAQDFLDRAGAARTRWLEPSVPTCTPTP